MRYQDLTGQTFGRWTVVNLHDKVRYTYPNGTGCTVLRWLCRCACGVESVVRGNTLRNGGTVSCGCYQSEFQRSRKTTHGSSSTPEYHAWAHMLDRCRNPKSAEYHNYGGRGITVCAEWGASFVRFLADVGKRPSAQHSLERKENERGYEPDNCKWATSSEQCNNQRRSRRLRYNGQVRTIAQWSEITGISQTNIWNRIADGWTTTEALTIPVDSDPAGWNVRRLRQG